MKLLLLEVMMVNVRIPIELIFFIVSYSGSNERYAKKRFTAVPYVLEFIIFRLLYEFGYFDF